MDQIDRNIFSDRLREAMGDMSAIELADKLGCNKSVISLYLSKQRVPSKMAIQLLALVLGVNPAWLYGLDAPKESRVRIVAAEKAPALSGERRQLMDLIPYLSDEAVHAMLILAAQAGRQP